MATVRVRTHTQADRQTDRHAVSESVRDDTGDHLIVPCYGAML